MSLPFSDTTNKSGILQECESWVFGGDYGIITGNTNRLATFTRLCNLAMDEIITKIFQVDERWQFDDTNHTDYPIGTTTLVAGQQDYTIDVTQIKITGVDIKDASGNYQPLKPMDMHDVRKYGKGQSLTEYQETDGMPLKYDVTANGIFLYPAPAAASVTLASGMKVYFQRAGHAFVVGDTTAVPGFPSLFHQLVAIKASNKYAKQNSMTDKARELDVIEAKREAELVEFYSNRHLENDPIITPFNESNK